MAAPERPTQDMDSLTVVARVRHTQGRRGELAADILTDFPDRFVAGARFQLAAVSGRVAESREYLLENAWFHKGQVILKFAGVEDISQAELLVGCQVLISSSERRPLPEGAVYLGDLVGCQVLEGSQEIGRVADWEDTGGGILLHVDPAGRSTPGGEILIPFAREICTGIDLQRRVIEVRLPEGLLELNAAVDESKHAARMRRGSSE